MKLIIYPTGELAELAHFYFTNDSKYEVCGFTIDSKYINSKTFLGLPLIDFNSIEKYYSPNDNKLFIAIGYSNLNLNRINKYNEAKEKGYSLASYISSKSTSWPGLIVGENTFIMKDNTRIPFCEIGSNVLIWVNNIIAHHMIIEDHVTITSHAAIGRNVIIKEQAFIDLNSTIRNNTTIGKGSIIGTASNIVKDVDEYTVMMGNPGKPAGKDTQYINL